MFLTSDLSVAMFEEEIKQLNANTPAPTLPHPIYPFPDVRVVVLRNVFNVAYIFGNDDAKFKSNRFMLDLYSQFYSFVLQFSTDKCIVELPRMSHVVTRVTFSRRTQKSVSLAKSTAISTSAYNCVQ